MWGRFARVWVKGRASLGVWTVDDVVGCVIEDVRCSVFKEEYRLELEGRYSFGRVAHYSPPTAANYC